MRAVTHGPVPTVPRGGEAGSGTLLLSSGGGAINPHPAMANINIGAAALRNWTLNLNQVLEGSGVYAGHIAIGVWIGSGPPEAEPDTIAAEYWDLYTERDRSEVHYVA